MGKDVFGMIKDFGARGKIFAVHFRNVSSPMPKFHETLQDDGYLDMYQVMKALREVKCQASLSRITIRASSATRIEELPRPIPSLTCVPCCAEPTRKSDSPHQGASHGVRSRSTVRVPSTLMTGAWLSCTVSSSSSYTSKLASSR